MLLQLWKRRSLVDIVHESEYIMTKICVGHAIVQIPLDGKSLILC